jgi:hypothetical protein
MRCKDDTCCIETTNWWSARMFPPTAPREQPSCLPLYTTRAPHHLLLLMVIAGCCCCCCFCCWWWRRPLTVLTVS